MSIVCEEIFDEHSHPSIEEIKDYAVKIGIDPLEEPQLLPIAAEGLMKALPPAWKPCYDDKKKSYYYYNKSTGKTQWEHPLDNIYRNMVKKARADSQSVSLGEPTDDATYARDDLPSLEEPPFMSAFLLPKKLQPLLPPTKPSEKTAAGRLVRSPTVDLNSSPKHERKFVKQKSDDLILISKKFSLNTPEDLEIHPKTFNAKPELTIAGGGAMFLKSNTRKVSPNDDDDKVISGDWNVSTVSKTLDSIEVDELVAASSKVSEGGASGNKKSTPLTSEADDESSEKKAFNPILKVSLTPQTYSKSPFELTIQDEVLDKPPIPRKKIIKPNPTDFIKPTLMVGQSSDSEDESPNQRLKKLSDTESESSSNVAKKTREMEERLEGRVEKLKQKMWKPKTIESYMTKSSFGASKEDQMEAEFGRKKKELEKVYDDKFKEVERELKENFERKKGEIIEANDLDLERLKQEHEEMVEDMKKRFEDEKERLREEQQNELEELKNNVPKELDNEKTVSKYEEEEKFGKLMGEKKLLEDKYKCLKEKYLRLKNDVRLTMEKRNRKKEETRSGTTTTGSETERSFSANKERQLSNASSKKHLETSLPPKVPQNDNYAPKENDFDTSTSDRSDRKNDNSDNSLNNRRSRKKFLFRMRASAASRAPNRLPPERSCSPVENLRRQLQKLEDLEDQFPQNQHSDTYHLRYPFAEANKYEGSSELEFFRHRIHLERDSIKRAKESLRSQKNLFHQRQKELKLKHGSMARNTYQQLCQEEKDLTDMEVSLHRTRSLLGEKVIRLRHLERTLNRAAVTKDSKYDDATLSDISSHSASSGISSTEFATADVNFGKGLVKGNSLEEPSEIIQSLENLNSEIREIWEVLKTQHQQTGSITAVIPPFVYPDLNWPVLSGSVATLPAPPSIPTLADRLNSYRQHVALTNAQSTVVTHAANQGATTTLVERTRNLKHWLSQARIDNNGEAGYPHANLRNYKIRLGALS